MTLIIIAVIAVVVATIAIYYDRRAQERKQIASPQDQKSVEAKTTEGGEAAPQKSNVMENMTGWVRRLTGNRQVESRRFQEWADANIKNHDLKEWIVNLSPEAAQALTEQVAEFCVNLGFELEWLLEGRLAQDPEIEAGAREVVVSYCSACWRATQEFADFELFKTMRAIEQNPFDRAHHGISRKLFAELVKADLAPSVPAELFVASERERQEHMTQAIRQASTSDREAFKRALRNAIIAEHEPAANPKDASTEQAGNQQGGGWNPFNNKKAQTQDGTAQQGKAPEPAAS